MQHTAFAVQCGYYPFSNYEGTGFKSEFGDQPNIIIIVIIIIIIIVSSSLQYNNNNNNKLKSLLLLCLGLPANELRTAKVVGSSPFNTCIISNSFTLENHNTLNFVQICT
jgi:hypothetical protein